MPGLRSTPLSEVVADSLRQSLRDGVYLCGERIAESVIAREMNVSQNTARDALNILEREGWVIKQARRGVMVPMFSVDDVRELYTLRARLEQLALDWALEVMIEANHAELANAVSEARLQAGMGNRRGLREAIFRFHEYIAKVANKPQTAAFIYRLHNQCRLLENLRTAHDPRDEDSNARLLTDYGNLLTRIRYDERQVARKLIHDMIMEEGRSLMPLLDLLR